jgi:hypothetical protein
MPVLLFTVLLFISLMSFGCSHSGDVGNFLVHEVESYGGHANTNIPLPKLVGKWTIKHDNEGFQIVVTETSFAEVDSFMQKAFGIPKVVVEKNLNGQPQRVYDATQAGMALQCINRPDGIEIVGMKSGQLFFKTSQ